MLFVGAAPALLLAPTLTNPTAGQSAGFGISNLAAGDSVTFHGGGWGHGVGISHYGMKLRAEAGQSASQILAFYYPGTTLATGWTQNDLRVLLATARDSSRFRPRGAFEITIDGVSVYASSQTQLFTVGLSGGIWTASTSDGVNMCPETGCAGGVFRIITADGIPVETSSTRRSYSHGQMELSKLTESSYRIVLASLPIEDYLKGIAEIPPTWPTESLRAQAVASRTYALHITSWRRSDAGWRAPFELYANTYHQVYAGNDREAAPNAAPWLNAVRDTAGQILTYGNQPILAAFTTSNGGYTANSGYAFTKSLPYLTATPDPYTSADPFANWSRTYSVASLSKWLNRTGDTSVGTLQSIQVSGNISPSGRIDRATVHLTGTSGSKTVSGARLVSAINAGAKADGLPELSGSDGRGGHLMSTKLTFGKASSTTLPPPIEQAAPTPPSASAAPTTTPVTQPSVPQGVSVSSGAEELVVRWSAPASNGGSSNLIYVVTWHTGGGSPQHHETSATSLRIGQLTNGARYEVSVAAKNQAGRSAPVASSGTPLSPPGAPLNVALSRGNGFLDVTWSAPGQNGGRAISGYEVAWQPEGGGVVSASTSTLGYRIGDLRNGVAYSVFVKAQNAVGASQPSQTQRMTPADAPGKPEGVSADAHDGHIHVNWQPPKDNGGLEISGYLVSVTPAGGETKTFEAAAGSTTYDVPELLNGLAYSIHVAARNLVGTSSPSANVSATPAGLPSSPREVFASRGDGRISIGWEPPSDNGGLEIEGYEVSWEPASNPETNPEDAGASGGSAALAAGDDNHTIEGLINGITYSVSVSARNQLGSSEPSTPVEATPAGLPGAPGKVTLARGDTSIDVAWTPPKDDGGVGVIGYTVTWSPLTAEGARVQEPSSMDVETPGYRIASLTNGVTYAVAVKANNEVGISTSSEELRTTPITTPGHPQSVKVVHRSEALEITWEPPADDGGSAVSSYTVTWVPLETSEVEGEESEEVGEKKKATSTGTSFIISDLTEGATYRITLTANNEAGASRFVAAAEATARKAAPAEEARGEITAVRLDKETDDSVLLAQATRTAATKRSQGSGKLQPSISNPTWNRSPSNGMATLTLTALSLALFGSLLLLTRLPGRARRT